MQEEEAGGMGINPTCIEGQEKVKQALARIPSISEEHK